MVEKGRVVEVGRDGTVIVEVDRHEACRNCSAKSACNPGVSGKTHRANAFATIDLVVGDIVEIEISDGAMARAVVWAYLIPSGLMLAGIFATWFGLAGSGLDSYKDIIACFGGLAGAGLGFLFMRLVNNRIRKAGTRAHARFAIRVTRKIEGE